MNRRTSGAPGSAEPAAALLQLPILDPDPELARANVPLAAGCLKAAALADPQRASAGGAGPSILIPPPELVDHGGDQALLAWLERGDFALAGFTTYLWNLERSLWLARELKGRRPRTRVLFGGPEIVAGRPLLASPAVDAFVLGEGEAAFLQVLDDLAAGRTLARLYQSRQPAELGELPNPYLCGALEARPDRPMYVETMRGCPYRCSYCFYGKHYPTVRSYPADRLAPLFALAQGAGVPELYFMDPSFNAAPGLEERLRHIAALNRTGIPLHTEIRLESVTPRIAALLCEAGFATVEVGLQSTNPQALRAIRRHWSRDRFLRGAERLRRLGVGVRIGIILGLPFDGLGELEATLGFLSDHGLSERLEVYPLSLLPGTELRERAEDLGIRFMDLPPYWVLSTNRLEQAELLQAVRLIERHLDAELFPPIIPAFRDPAPGLTGYLDLREPRAISRLREAPPCLASCLTVHLRGEQLERPAELEELESFADGLRSSEPFALVQLVIESQGIPARRPARRLAERFRSPGHLFERSRSLHEDLQGSFSARLFHLTDRPAVARRYYDHPEPFDLMLRYPPGLLGAHRELLEEHPLLLVDPELPSGERAGLAALYRGFERLIIASAGSAATA